MVGNVWYHIESVIELARIKRNVASLKPLLISFDGLDWAVALGEWDDGTPLL